MERINILYAWIATDAQGQQTVPTSTIKSPTGQLAVAPMLGKEEAILRSMVPTAQAYATLHQANVALRAFALIDGADLAQVTP